jgi:hypothetical protein
MSHEQDLQAPTSRDEPRPAATGPEYDYSLSIDDVSERYAAAGHPRTIRTLQRYCASGHLDSRKVATAIGDKYLIAPYSVSRHIAQINETIAFTTPTTSRDEPWQVATVVVPRVGQETQETAATSPNDTSRQVAADDIATSRDVARLEREVERLHDDREFLREQIKVKDTQISSLLERDRETNILVRGLQEMLTPLLGWRRDPPTDANHQNL